MVGYERSLGKYIARDDGGNEFEKEVIQRFEDGRWLIDFGWPAIYHLESLILHSEPKFIERPDFHTGFNLDINGMNHKGFKNVCISREDFLEIMKKAKMPVEDE